MLKHIKTHENLQTAIYRNIIFHCKTYVMKCDRMNDWMNDFEHLKSTKRTLKLYKK